MNPSRFLPPPLYATPLGSAHLGSSLGPPARLPEESVDLVIASPPFALNKPVGNTCPPLPFASCPKRPSRRSNGHIGSFSREKSKGNSFPFSL